MAFPWAAAIAGGTGLASSIISASATQKANHDARNFALMQGDIEWQRQLMAFQLQNAQEKQNWERQNSYNEKLWNMQNAYNSPASQMARFKEAGLNPNLIYGQQNTGGSIQTANLESSGALHGSRPGNWRPDPVRFDPREGILAYLNAREQSARTDNLEAQNKVLEEEKNLKIVQAANVAADTKGKNFDIGLKSDLRKTSIDFAETNLKKAQNEILYAERADTRAGNLNAAQIKEMSQRVANMIAEQKKIYSEIEKTKIEREVQKEILKMYHNGYTPHDNILMRKMMDGIKSLDNLPKWNGKILPGHWDEKAQTYFFGGSGR